MKYLLDTDTCVFWLRQKNISLRQQLVAAGKGQTALSAITLAELHYGAASSNQPGPNEQAIELFAGEVVVLDFGTKTASLFGDIKAELRRTGELLEDADLMIASTALEHQLILVTNNQKHFKRINRLQLENWIE